MKTIIPPPILGIIIGVGMWAVDHFATGYSLEFTGRALIAAVVVATGVVIDVIAIYAFFKAKTTVNPLQPEKANTLVISGLYQFSRNPMYLGMLLILIGWAIYLSNPLNLLLLCMFVLTINTLQIIPEEKVLEIRFGQQYSDYKNRVRRWI